MSSTTRVVASGRGHVARRRPGSRCGRLALPASAARLPGSAPSLATTTAVRNNGYTRVRVRWPSWSRSAPTPDLQTSLTPSRDAIKPFGRGRAGGHGSSAEHAAGSSGMPRTRSRYCARSLARSARSLARFARSLARSGSLAGDALQLSDRPQCWPITSPSKAVPSLRRSCPLPVTDRDRPVGVGQRAAPSCAGCMAEHAIPSRQQRRRAMMHHD